MKKTEIPAKKPDLKFHFLLLKVILRGDQIWRNFATCTIFQSSFTIWQNFEPTLINFISTYFHSVNVDEKPFYLRVTLFQHFLIEINDLIYP